MHKVKGAGALPFKHHTFCLTQEATFTDVYRTIQIFLAHNKHKTADQELITEFGLAYSQLLELPEELYKLTWLQKLSLNYHRLSTLPESLEKLHNLQYLFLDHNRLTCLPNALSSLVHLKVLSLSHNKLRFLCPLGKLMNLETLNLQENKLLYLPTEISQLSNLQELNVKDNPLISPPVSVAQRGLAEIVSFLNDLETGVRQYSKLKLMILGDVGSGKTHLAQWLRAKRSGRKGVKKAAHNAATSGEAHTTFTYEFEGMVEAIPFRPKSKQSVSITVWDFDSPAVTKDLTRSLHMQLMTPRTVYLLAWNVIADPKATNLSYWLESIASKFPQSSAILAATHSDLVEGSEQKGEIREVLAGLSEKYSCISRVAFVSCVTGSGLERLREMLEDVCASQSFLREKVPASFLGLEEAIGEEKKSRNPPVMLWQEFVSLATICNVTGSLNLYKAAQLFNDTGLIIHLTIKNLAPPIVVLDHNWLLDFVTQLTFNINSVHNKDGILKGRELQHVVALPGIIEMYWGMLELLQTIEVIFPLTRRTLDSSDHDAINYLLPRWLPEATPLIKRIWRETDPDVPHNYDRIYVLNIIPDGIFGKLLASMDPIVKIEYWWKNCVLVSSETCESLAFIELSGNELSIEIRSFKPPVPFFQQLIDIIESILTYRLSPLITRYVTCTVCQARRDPRPNRLQLHTCELAYLDHQTLVECFPEWGPSHLTPLSSLLPELTFSPFTSPSPSLSSVPSSSSSSSSSPPSLSSSLGSSVGVLSFNYNTLDLMEELGSGAYGVVYKARMSGKENGEGENSVDKEKEEDKEKGKEAEEESEKQGEVVAVKRLENAHKDGYGADSVISREEKLNMFLEFWHEASILNKLHHQCIAGLRGVCFEPLSMALEYISGPSLYNFINDRSCPISWRLILRIAKDLARALNYMHSQDPPIIHRDLKSPNVLLLSTDPNVDTTEPVVKLLDFGTAAVLYGDTVWERVVDQPTWQAPEILAQLPYWEACDIYSYGIILWELVCRSHPFDEFSYSLWMSMLEDEIIKGLRPTLPPTTQLNRDFANLIRSCWRQDPTRRPTFADVLVALEHLVFLEEQPPPVPPALVQKKDKISVDDQFRRHSQSISRATSARRRIQNKSYSSPPIAPKIHKNLRTSATLAALFGEDGVFGERPRANTIAGPPSYSMMSTSAPAAPSYLGSSPPPSLVVTISENARTLIPSTSSSSLASRRSSTESIGSNASLGTGEAMDTSLGSSVGSGEKLKLEGLESIGSAGSVESVGSFDMASPASVDSSRLLHDNTRVSLLSSRSYGGSMGSLTVGRRHVSSSKSSTDIGQKYKHGESSTPRVHILEETTIITSPTFRKIAFNEDDSTNNNNTTTEERTDTTVTDEDTSVDDISLRDGDPEIVIVSPPYQSPKRKARTISDAATKMNHSPSRFMSRTTSDATVLIKRNRAFSDADMQSAADSDSETESESEDNGNNNNNNNINNNNYNNNNTIRNSDDVDSRLTVARQRAFSDADMETSMLIHSDQSYNNLGGSSTNVNRGTNGSGGVSRGRILGSGSVGKSSSKYGSFGESESSEAGEGYASMKSSVDSNFGEISAMEYNFDYPEPQFGVILASDTWDHGVGKGTRKWAKVGSAPTFVRAATLPKLIEMMTRGLTKLEMNYASKIVPSPWTPDVGLFSSGDAFVENFLLSYRLFTTPAAIFDLLMLRFYGPPLSAMPYQVHYFNQHKNTIVLGVANFMKKFLEDLQQDELKAANFKLYGKIQKFLQGDFANVQPFTAKHMIQIIVNRRDKVSTLRRHHEKFGHPNSMAGLEKQEDLSLERGRSVSVDLSPQLETPLRRPTLYDFYDANQTARAPRMDRSNTLDFIRSPQALQHASIGLTKEELSEKYHELVAQMRDPTSGVPIKDRKYKNKVYTKSFMGSEAVDWLMKTQSINRETALKTMKQIFSMRVIYHLGEENEFYDGSYFYTFMDDNMELMAHQYTILDINRLAKISPSEIIYALGQFPSAPALPPNSPRTASSFQVPSPTSSSIPSSPPIFSSPPLSPSYSSQFFEPTNLPKLEGVRDLCPNLVPYLEWCTKVTLSVSTQIVKQKDPRIRAEVIDKFILIAAHFMQLNNFNGVMMVLNSLFSEPITKLLLTWKKVPPKSLEMLQDICKAIMGEGHLRYLRKSMDEFCSVRVPHSTDNTFSVPYFGIILADLAQIHYEQATFLENGFLNVQKIYKIGKKMKQLQIFQRRLKNYSLTSVNWIQEAITNTNTLTDNQIARISQLHVQEQAEGVEGEGERAGPGGGGGGGGGGGVGGGGGIMISGMATAASGMIVGGAVGGGPSLTTSSGVVDPTSPAPPILTERDWALIFGSASAVRHTKGACVLSEGEFSTRVFRVKSGRLRMEKKDVNGFHVRSGTVEVNGMFGEFSLLGANSGHRFVIESNDAELWVIEVAHVSALFAVQAKLCAKFYRIFAVNLASKLASFPSTPQSTPLETTGNTGNYHIFYTMPKDGESDKHSSKSDSEFKQEFQLGDEYVIKEYNCHIKRAGKLYITQNHVCFSSRRYGLKSKKKIPICEIQSLEASPIFYNQAVINKGKKVYKITFQKQQERDEGLEILKGLWAMGKKSLATKNNSNNNNNNNNSNNNNNNNSSKELSALDLGFGDVSTSTLITALRERIKAQGALTEHDWRVISKDGAKRRVFNKDELIIEEGDRLYRIYQVTQGTCRLEKKREGAVNQVVGKVETNETFGEVAFLTYGCASSSVIADDKVEIFMIERQYVNILYELNPDLAGRWFKYLASALQKTLYLREKQLYYNDK